MNYDSERYDRWWKTRSRFLLLAAISLAALCPASLAAPKSTTPRGTINLASPATLDPRAIEGFINGLVLRGTGDYYGAIANFREALKYELGVIFFGYHACQ